MHSLESGLGKQVYKLEHMDMSVVHLLFPRAVYTQVSKPAPVQ